MPRNIVIASAAIVTSVAAAFFASGGLNAGTPSETASTPVIAVQPLANAVRSRNVVSGLVPAHGGGGALAGVTGRLPKWYNPAAINARRTTADTEGRPPK